MKELVFGSQKLGLELSDQQVRAFELYLVELLDWNKRINLTSVTQPDDVIRVHFLDSLTVLLGLTTEDRQGTLNILDVGTGGGFPGIPLAIACPHFRVELLEATGKKVAFLTQVIRSLKLNNVSVINGRAEEIAHVGTHRGAYDLVVSRAVARLATSMELAVPFVVAGGRFVSQKKGDFRRELESSQTAMKLMGATLEEVRWIEMEEIGEPRALVVYRKTQETPSKFPRATGIPRKRPL